MYFKRVGIALSVLLNVVLGGYSNQSFSARNWQWKMDGKHHMVWLIDFLCRNPDHCAECWTYWYIRKYK